MTAFHRSKEWSAFTRKARPILAATLPAPCVNAYAAPGCGGVVMPGQRFDVAHIVSHAIDPTQPLTLGMVGPAHTMCNRKAGAREGGRKRATQKRAENPKRLPPEGSGW